MSNVSVVQVPPLMGAMPGLFIYNYGRTRLCHVDSNGPFMQVPEALAVKGMDLSSDGLKEAIFVCRTIRKLTKYKVFQNPKYISTVQLYLYGI